MAILEIRMRKGNAHPIARQPRSYATCVIDMFGGKSTLLHNLSFDSVIYVTGLSFIFNIFIIKFVSYVWNK